MGGGRFAHFSHSVLACILPNSDLALLENPLVVTVVVFAAVEPCWMAADGTYLDALVQDGCRPRADHARRSERHSSNSEHGKRKLCKVCCAGLAVIIKEHQQ